MDLRLTYRKKLNPFWSKELKAIARLKLYIIVPFFVGSCLLYDSRILAQDVVFPGDAGIRNVKKEFGAKGNGVTDDTQAIQNAFKACQGNNQTVYFPAGTYIVSNPVWFRSWMTVQGQNTQKTIIKLKDKAPGYQDPSKPNWLMATTQPMSPVGRSGDNTAFSSFVRNLTLDTGRGNPGAIAIQFISNNGGGLENITIRSGDRGGLIGLDLRTPWNGPSLFKNVRIDGFDYGIVSWNSTYFSTFEFISLSNQHIAGWENRNHPLVVRKLISSQNGVPAIINSPQQTGDEGHFVILDSQLNNSGGNGFAIQNDKDELFAHNVSTTGYQSAIRKHGLVIPGKTVNEYVSGQVYMQFPSPPTSLNLPIKDTPSLPWEPMQNWVSVKQFTDRVKDGDWGPAIQAAIDSGKSTIYFPVGVYPIRSTVIVRNNVKVLQGLGSEFMADKNAYNGKPIFRIESGASSAVWIDRLAFSGAKLAVEDASSQTLVVLNSRYMSYRNAPGAGELFVENMPASPWYFQYPQKVWIRGLNTESGDTKVINNAADLWIMGWKSEGLGTELDNGAQARTEILGGLFYPAYNGDRTLNPLILNRGGRLSAVHTMFWSNTDYVDTWNGIQKLLRLPLGTRFMPLYVTNPM